VELRTLIRRMTTENRLWGQRRIQAELARLGFKVSARTVAKYATNTSSRAVHHLAVIPEAEQVRDRPRQT
jgi:arginine repressor